MPSFSTKRRVPFTADEMFAIVADVEQYPQFLPLCEGLTIQSRRAVDGGGEDLVATMAIGYKTIRESFTTNVALRPADKRILVEYRDGPFKHLENRWAFIDVAPGVSDVDFYITYAFKSPLLGALMGAVFDKAFRRFAEAFEERAGVVYGRRSPAVG